ncbi:MAG: PAS domain-containing sensor histidine kinase [Bdellovibrionota bacterium]
MPVSKPKKNPRTPSRAFKKTKPAKRDNRYSLLVKAVESIRDYGIFMLDSRGNLLTWNKGAERMLGYEKGEILGKNFSAFYTEEDNACQHPETELKEAKKVGRYEEEGWRLRRDGSRFWASVVISKLTNSSGKLMGFSVVTRNLTARKRIEDRLRESEERFRLLVDNVTDYAIFMLDLEGRVASWNDGAERIKGYRAKEIVGEHFSIFYPPEVIASGKCDKALREAELNGHYLDEGWRLRKDGSRFWASVVISAIRDRSKKLIGYSKVTRDLSEKKRTEDQLQSAYSDLEIRVAERTSALEGANAKLEASERELKAAIDVRDEFISIASHELKTPITSLKMQTQMLLARRKSAGLEALNPVRFEKFLDGALRQVDRLAVLVDDLLDVARAQSQKLTFRFEPTDLSALGEEVAERLKEQVEAAGCSLEIETSEPVVGRFDRFRLDQVMVNLLTNAIKYAPGSKIRISTRTQGAAALLTVRDHGPGIPLDVQAKLFERFERGNNANNVGGLGLGLFITREIVHGHQGSIRVESRPGEGAAFHVELPLVGG